MTLPIVAAGLAVASSAASYAQGSAQASAANKTNRAISARNSAIATETALRSYGQLNEKQLQEQSKAARQIQEITREAALAKATTAVGAAASGVKGQSIEELLSNFEKQELDNIGVTKENLIYTSRAIADDKKAVRSGYESRLLASIPDIVAKPSLVGSLLSAGTSAIGAYASVKSAVGPTPDKNPGSNYEYHT